MIVIKLFEEGSLSTISGCPGSGKTDYAELLSYLALKQGYHVISNIQLDIKKSIAEIIVYESKLKSTDGDFSLTMGMNELKYSGNVTKLLENYHHIKNDIQFLQEIVKHRHNILVLDEVGLFSTSKRAMSFDAITFELFISGIRKFYCCLIFIIQRYNTLLPMIRELSFANISKVTKTEAIIELYPINKVLSIGNIPKSPLNFMTHGFSGFTYLLDWFKLTSDLKDLDDNQVVSFLKKQSKTNFVKYMRYEK